MTAGEIVPENVARSFGAVLKSFRLSGGLSQEKLAEAIEMDRTYVSMLERGVHQPTLTVILRIACVLDVSPCDLVNSVDEKIRADE